MVAPVFRLASGFTELFTGKESVALVPVDRSSDNLSRANARRRCAALQDNGYPAGRWRVPTVGEMYFFKMLYNKGVLPDLFPNERAYWTAQYLAKFHFKDGPGNKERHIRPYPNNDLPGHKFVRCVYDDWYWVRKDKNDNWVPDNIKNNGDKIQLLDGYWTDGDMREMFVWGDKEKNNPLEQPEPQD